jgi:ABC-type phosphate transport system substrate-binding protein
MKMPTFFLFVFILFGCAPKEENRSNADDIKSERIDTISISACFSCERLTKRWIEEFEQANPAIHFHLSVNESSSCITSLSKGAQIAVISRDLLDEEDSLNYCVSSVAKHGVVLIVNENNPYINIIRDGISIESIKDMYQKGTWYPIAKENKYPLNLYFRTPKAGNTRNLINFLDINPDSLSGNQVETDLDMVESIRNDKFGLGYCSHINAYDLKKNTQVSGIKVVPLLDCYGMMHHFYDSLNLMKRAIWSGRYQFHLYPTIYIVLKEKPANLNVKKFLTWVFTSGQNVVEQEGYIRLKRNEIGCRIKDLEKL